MSEIRFILNEDEIRTEIHPGTTVLDFIRYHKNLKGTKIGCREGDCGACTILVGELIEEKLKVELNDSPLIKQEVRYRSATSCLMAIGNANKKHIVTIEGINFENGLNPIQQALADEGATQCGFCTPGFVVSLAGFCLSREESSEKNALACVDGNICRCTGYKSIERAAIQIQQKMSERKTESPADFVADKKILPAYFSSIKARLKELHAGSRKPPVNYQGNKTPVKLGGGTDLYVQQHDSIAYSEIDFLFDKTGNREIYMDGNRCYVGASATVTDLLESDIIQKHFPGFSKYAKLVSSTPIRNMATMAGNFVNASPIGDFSIFFLALDTTLILKDDGNAREVLLKNFFKGYKKLDKTPAESIEKFYFEIPDAGALFNFEKVSKRTHLDIASVNTAMQIKTEGNKIIRAVISAGGVFAYPKLLEKTGEFLKGKNITEDHILNATEIAQKEITPISDARGSEAYKRLLLSQLIKAHFMELFPDIERR